MTSDYQACNIQEVSSSHPGNFTNVTILNDLNVVFQSSSR